MAEHVLEHPAQLLTAVHDADGIRVGLRLARPNDAPRVRAFLERLEPETRLRRFATPMPRVPSRLVRHFTFPDGRRRIVVLVTAPVEGTERVVGIADVAVVRPGTGEIAVVVADELQGRGVGRLLAHAAAALAARRGVRRLRGEIGLGGPAALALMKALGATVTSVEDGSPVAVTALPVPDEWEHHASGGGLAQRRAG